MICNKNQSPLRTFPSLESYWKSGNIYGYTIPNYPSADPAIHYADGWRDYVAPSYNTETHRLGELIYDAENDVVTRETPALTDEELKGRLLSSAQAERENALQEKVREQTKTALQAITDDAEAIANQSAYPIWENLDDEYAFGSDFKCQALDGLELKLFKIIQPHAKQSDRHPNLTPALWSKIEIGGDGVEIWTQPIGGDGKYPYIDPASGQPYKVTHAGKTWVNIHQGSLNVWEPGVFGWQEIL